MSALDSRACHIHATSAAKETGRQKTAAASQASTNCSKRSLILLIRIMPMSKNGRVTTIPLRSMHFRSNTPSVASQTAATPPRRASPRKNTPPLLDRREQTPRGPYRTVTPHSPRDDFRQFLRLDRSLRKGQRETWSHVAHRRPQILSGADRLSA